MRGTPVSLGTPPTARHAPFVGRESELDHLRSLYEAATGVGGNGALVMLVGEPGIGKTAICEQLVHHVVRSGGQVLLGHCYDAGSFRPPYQPFVEAFGGYLHDCAFDALSGELVPALAELARIIPAVRERLNVRARPPADPEEDRWRLLQAATDLLYHAAAKYPVLLVLEDLQDADRGTLDLVIYLAHNLSAARILVVGTYRDVAVDRTHPLSAALTELYRANNVARLQVRGLSMDEVHELLAETSQQRVPHPLAELVHRQTDGNPLFVRETLRYVIEEGLVEPRDGALRRVGETPLTGRIPEGLRDAVGKRLSRLRESTNRVLSVASVIGREFELDVLRKVVARAEDELEAALEEASSAAIIQEKSVTGATVVYRFGHAFFRQTLYEEMVAPRRIRLHQQVARAVEDIHRQRLDEHAAELAEHYAFSSDTLDLAKAVHYGEVAARRAADVFAYGEAARHLESALVVQEVADPADNAKRCDLLLALGESLWPAGETTRVVTRMAPDALALAKSLDDQARASRACQLALDAFVLQGANVIGAVPEFISWAEQARAYAAAESVERVKADVALSLVRETETAWQEARLLRAGALALARRLGNQEVLFSSAFWVMGLSAAHHWDERLRLVEESSGWLRDRVSGRTLGVFLWRCGCVMLSNGNRVRAEALWREVEEVAARTHVATVRLLVAQSTATLAIVDGQLEYAVELSRRYVERADALGAPGRGRYFSLLMLHTPLLHVGRAGAWLEALEEFNGPAVAGFARSWVGRVARGLCLAECGRLEEGRALVAPLLDEVGARRDDDETPMEQLVGLLRSAVAFEHRPAARVLLERLASAGHLAMCDWAFPTSIARHLGDASALLGDTSAAHGYYLEGLESAEKINLRPELALIHLRLAELLLADGAEPVRSAALAHLEVAIPELEEMHMQPSLERARALRHAHSPIQLVASEALTAREREIASLIARGLSNRQIAEQLVISQGTVEVHVKHILGKLGFTSRKQVGEWMSAASAG